ncbi:MAG: metallophosphoesterase [Deltaproteobacteria bacterium]|nr:metallophosphoesterase [Deltaproteobacteria bacterium]
MALKLLHTSDVHIGLKFASHEDVAPTLIAARFECLERLIQRASKEKCDLVVIAGDLFDRVGVPKSDVLRVAQILAEFEGHLVTVLPGNHDYVDPDRDAPWKWLKEKAGDNLLILDRPGPVDLSPHGVPAVLYPCPCSAKHSEKNAVGWVADVDRNQAIPHHIGIAHGSLEGVSPDFAQNYFPMKVGQLRALPVDLWLLGHTHIPFPQNPATLDRIFFAGTPEPDGFDCAHKGTAWIHEFDDQGALRSTLLTAGRFAFRHDEVKVENADDVESLRSRYQDPASKQLLLKLKVSGRLPDEVHASLAALPAELKKHLFWLQFDDSAVTRQITKSDIDGAFTEGSFPHRLLTRLAQHDADQEALQEAYRLIQEVRR